MTGGCGRNHSKKLEFRDIVIDHKCHERKEQYEARLLYRKLYFMGDFAPENLLVDEHDQMSPVEGGDGEDVEDGEAHAELGHEPDEDEEARLGALRGELGDGDR